MIDSVVFGNGESRKHFNTKNLAKSVALIGCNAIHRDMVVDHLICCDRRMAEEATNNPQTKSTAIYVREDWVRYYRKIKKCRNVHALPDLPYTGNEKADQPQHWGSGCYATLLAAKLNYNNIMLVGFDLYSSNNLVNNIYKGTPNYSAKDSDPVDYSFWVYQMAKIFYHYRDRTFTLVNIPGWDIPKEWNAKNVIFEDFSNHNS